LIPHQTLLTGRVQCIRPLINLHYPGFCCPLCRTFADLEAEVEVEPSILEPEEKEDEEIAQPSNQETSPATSEQPVESPIAITHDERKTSIVVSGLEGQQAEIPITVRTREGPTDSSSSQSSQSQQPMDPSRTVVPPNMEWRQTSTSNRSEVNNDETELDQSTPIFTPIPISMTRRIHFDREGVDQSSHEEVDQTRFGRSQETSNLNEDGVEGEESSLSSAEVPEPFQTASTPPNNLSSLSERVLTSLNHENGDDEIVEDPKSLIAQRSKDESFAQGGDIRGSSRVVLDPISRNSLGSVSSLSKRSEKSLNDNVGESRETGA
jgi:hypothetical protein